MGYYNVIDLIDKTINIEQRRKVIIQNVADDNLQFPAIKVISKILCNQIDEMMKYYGQLKDEIKNTELEDIDVGTYDKISFLINEFNNKVYVPKVTNVREYLYFTLDLYNDKYSLFIDVQGRLVNNTSANTYEILSKIIKNISQQIKVIEKTII